MSMTMDKETQTSLTPSQAIEKLKQGNVRFLNQEPAKRDLLSQVEATAAGQFPFASIVSCIDSRIPTEIIFDQGVGDVFNARIAGNFVNEDILGSLEFACKLAGSKAIVIMGHTACGAVKGACDAAELGNLTQMLGKIRPAVDSVQTDEGTDRSSGNIEFVNHVAEVNVRMTQETLLSGSPVLKEMIDQGEVALIGAMYDVASGEVKFLD